MAKKKTPMPKWLSKGGKAAAKKLTAEQRKARAQAGAKARWGK